MVHISHSGPRVFFAGGRRYRSSSNQGKRNRPPHNHLRSLRQALEALKQNSNSSPKNQINQIKTLNTELSALERKIQRALDALEAQLRYQKKSQKEIDAILHEQAPGQVRKRRSEKLPADIKSRISQLFAEKHGLHSGNL